MCCAGKQINEMKNRVMSCGAFLLKVGQKSRQCRVGATQFYACCRLSPVRPCLFFIRTSPETKCGSLTDQVYAYYSLKELWWKGCQRTHSPWTGKPGTRERLPGKDYEYTCDYTMKWYEVHLLNFILRQEPGNGLREWLGEVEDAW